jgi:hypothetical protein
MQVLLTAVTASELNVRSEANKTERSTGVVVAADQIHCVMFISGLKSWIVYSWPHIEFLSALSEQIFIYFNDISLIQLK